MVASGLDVAGAGCHGPIFGLPRFAFCIVPCRIDSIVQRSLLHPWHNTVTWVHEMSNNLFIIFLNRGRLCLLLLNYQVTFHFILQSQIPLSWRAPQSIELNYRFGLCTVYTNWTWDNGNIVCKSLEYGPTVTSLNVSVFTSSWSTTVYRSMDQAQLSLVSL